MEEQPLNRPMMEQQQRILTNDLFKFIIWIPDGQIKRLPDHDYNTFFVNAAGQDIGLSPPAGANSW
jgi:hypothetical protein